MKPQNHNLSDPSELSVGLINSDQVRGTSLRKPAGLTITVEKLDHLLAEIQFQIEGLRRKRTDLGLVRVQLADMESWWKFA